jgi:hypothetical protein
LQTDRGKDFLGKACTLLYKSKHIIYKPKFGKNKANFAENAIGRVKRKLYMLLRSQLSHDWVKVLPTVIESFNNTPKRSIGWLRPNDIKSKLDSLIVKEQRKKYGIEVYTEPSFHEQLAAQNIDKTTMLKVGDYVYLDFDEKLFDKSFDTQVCHKIFLKGICTFFTLKHIVLRGKIFTQK